MVSCSSCAAVRIDGNITNNTTLNADGGTVNGELTNNDQITGEDLNRSTTFNNKVTNNGTIRKGHIHE